LQTFKYILTLCTTIKQMSLHRHKATGTWSWPLTSIYCQA
jgi:hypothetical protein